MERAEREKFSGRLFALGIKPHLKGYAYLLTGAGLCAASGRAPSAEELSAACGVSGEHMARVLEMCVRLSAQRTGSGFKDAAELMRAVAEG